MGHPVAAPLMPFADVVEQRRLDELAVVVAPVEKPTCGVRGMHHVARFLCEEELNQVTIEEVRCEGTFPRPGFHVVVEKLAGTMSNHSRRSKTAVPTESKIRPRMLNCGGAIKLTTMSVIRMPGP